MYEILDNNNQIYRSQYGFRVKHSCEHVVGELVSNIVKIMQQKGKIYSLTILRLIEGLRYLRSQTAP